jgi:hypothetical protein
VLAWIKQLTSGSGASRRLAAEAKIDHVELTETHLVLGITIAWNNQTDSPIPVKEIQVALYLHKRSKEPLRFYPLERFVRVPPHRGFEKAPLRPFTLSSKETHTEYIRFLSQEVLDIEPGDYTIDIQLKDTSEVSYSSRVMVHVEGKVKYRRSEEWGSEN